jgi:DnaJ homolog subfamily C member 9
VTRSRRGVSRRVFTTTANFTVSVRDAEHTMDDHPDLIAQFFPEVEPESVDLYAVLLLTSEAKPDEIKKAYRKLALVHHPDKHATGDEDKRAEAALKFQQIGFAYTILSDEKKRERYDKTGRTDEGFDLGAGEDGWEAYFEDLFEKVTKQKLDELKKEYQGMNGTSFRYVYTPSHSALQGRKRS